MSAAKHTPAPWEVRGWSIKHPGNGVRIARVEEPDKRLKQFGDYEEDEAVCRANARLIAAAPDLLEALQAIENALHKDSRDKSIVGDGVEYHLDGQTMYFALNAARAALAKVQP